MPDNVIIATVVDAGEVQHQKIVNEFLDAGGIPVTVSAATPLPVVASVSISGVSTSSNQTDGSQKTQIVDAGGEAATVTGGKLDVNATIDTTGLATSAKQDTGNASLASIDGKITAVNTGAVVVASSALPTGAATSAKQDTGNTSLASIDAKLTNPLPVSGTVAVSNFPATQPVSAAALPLPTGASTEATLALIKAKTDNIPALGQALAVASTPVVLTAAQISTLTPQTNALTDTQLRATPIPVSGTVTVDTSLLATSANQATEITALGTLLTTSDFDTKTGSLTETAPATDTASSGLNGRLQRIAQRLTSLITALGSPFQAGGSIGNTSFGATQATAANLNATVVGTGTFATQATLQAGSALVGKVGIDQTTPGTTNKVSIGTDGTVAINAALPAGSNVIGHVIADSGSTTAVTGNVTVIQGTATNLKTQSETYQGGTAVGAANPMQVTGANGTFPVSGTITANPVVTDTAPATQNITTQDLASTTTAVANGQNYITGTPTANSAASFALASGFDTIRFLVTGTWTGTLSVEMSMDSGTTWTTQGVHQTGTAYTIVTATSNFSGQGNGAGFTNVRVRATAAMTGTATVKITQSINAASVYVGNALRLQDATTQSIQDTIKAASTLPALTDTALVTTQRDPLPAGTNLLGKVGIDQTTPGTTNATSLSQIGANTVATGVGASSTGTQRVVTATDSTIGTVTAVTAITNALPAGTNVIGAVNIVPTSSSTNAQTNSTSTAYEASRVIKASAGTLYRITGYNSKTSTQFIMVSNTTAVPADAQTPVVLFAVPASSNFSLDYGDIGRYFSTGICVFNSSTSPTKTIGAADCFFDCQYL